MTYPTMKQIRTASMLVLMFSSALLACGHSGSDNSEGEAPPKKISEPQTPPDGQTKKDPVADGTVSPEVAAEKVPSGTLADVEFSAIAFFGESDRGQQPLKFARATPPEAYITSYFISLDQPIKLKADSFGVKFLADREVSEAQDMRWWNPELICDENKTESGWTTEHQGTPVLGLNEYGFLLTGRGVQEFAIRADQEYTTCTKLYIRYKISTANQDMWTFFMVPIQFK